MWALIFFVSAYISATSAIEFTNEPLPHITLPRNTPISIGEIISFNGKNEIVAWLPASSHCIISTSISEFETFSIGENDPLAPGIDGLIFTGYHNVRAEITRSGKQFARCNIGPNSVKVETCVDGRGALRTWTCHVDETEEAQLVLYANKEQTVPKNVGEPPPEFARQEGTYQKWWCDEKGCRAQNEADD